MNKYAFTFLIAASTSLIWSHSAPAEVNVYTRENTPYASPYNSGSNSGSNFGYNQGSQSSFDSAANRAAETSSRNFQRESEARMEEYRMNMQDIMEQNRTKKPSILPPGNQLPLQPKKRVKREVLQKKQAVNGISGTWLPKKVWENDIDNDLGRTLLKNSTTTTSPAEVYTKPATERYYEEDVREREPVRNTRRDRDRNRNRLNDGYYNDND